MKECRLCLAQKDLFPSGKMIKSLLNLRCSLRANVKVLGLSKPQKSLDTLDNVTTKILHRFMDQGAEGLKGLKPGPKGNYRRTDEVVRQIIRYRFLDPNMSPEVVAQKLNQNGHLIAIRSVERVISEYGLQKKTPSLSSDHRTHKG